MRWIELGLGIILILFPASIMGQIPAQDCDMALAVCNLEMTQAQVLSGAGNLQAELPSSSPCLRIERNSIWYRVGFETAGDLCFSLIPDSPMDNFNWAVFRLGPGGCGDLVGHPEWKISCNGSYAVNCEGRTGPNGLLDCPDQNEACIAVNAGEEYHILVSNPSPWMAGFTLDFGASTARIATQSPPAPRVEYEEVCHGKGADIKVVPAEGGTVRWYHSILDSIPFFEGWDYVSPPLTETVRYYLETDRTQSCSDLWLPIEISPLPEMDATLWASDSFLTFPNPILRLALQSNIQIRDYIWSLGDGQTSQSPVPIHEYAEAGFYKIDLIATDIHGCLHRFSTAVEVKPLGGIFIPTAFSPNGDGKNDYWLIHSSLPIQFQVFVFNRFGNEVFQSSQSDFQWDGRDPNGRLLPNGVYTFSVHYLNYYGQLEQRSGTIQILR